jgi:CRP/FNR family transcriptional regulator, cyclic AMP receptor protein
MAPSLLELCRGCPQRELAPGAVLIEEGERSGRLFVLAAGTLEVYRGDVAFATATEPGAVFGEMSVLLDLPHTASVRALTPTRVHVVERAAEFLEAHPDAALPIAMLLARRLQHATSYLVDLKHQFQGYQDHFGMIDEVLESFTHQQDESFPPADELPPDP